MPKWEYCEVNVMYTPDKTITIRKFTPNGEEKEEQKYKSAEDFSKGRVVTIAKLGLAGWELVIIDVANYLFKRPLEEEAEWEHA